MTEMEIAEMTEIQVPTHDSRVRNWLRVLGEPMTLFGEDSKARKSRLQAFLNSIFKTEQVWIVTMLMSWILTRKLKGKNSLVLA